MRVGRLQAATLSNIWKSLELNLDADPANSEKQNLPEKLQKQYIPMNFDSPLYRLISIASESTSNSSALDIGQAPDGIMANHIAFFNRNPNRAMSVPAISMEPFNIHIPRVVQSTGNLFRMDAQSSQSHPFGEDIPLIPIELPGTISASGSNTPVTSRVRHQRSGGGLLSSSHGSTLTSQTVSWANYSKTDQEKKHWSEEYIHMDIDWSMQAMDVLYSASFYDYIRDESNCDLSAQRLCRIIKDYKPRQVANALLWMIQGWSVENTSKLLRTIFSDWLPDLAGCVFSLISRNWPKQPQASLCVAFLLMNEPAASSALFIRSMTQGWTRRESIDLLTYLDAVLKWHSAYLQEVMTVYTNSIFGGSQLEKGDLFDMKQKLPDLPKKESDISKASRKLMAANAKLAMAEYQLQLFQHWSVCTKCQTSSDDCEIAKNLPLPGYQHLGIRENSLDSKDSFFGLEESDSNDIVSNNSDRSEG